MTYYQKFSLSLMGQKKLSSVILSFPVPLTSNEQCEQLARINVWTDEYNVLPDGSVFLLVCFLT